jgi:hypothetical protein
MKKTGWFFLMGLLLYSSSIIQAQQSSNPTPTVMSWTKTFNFGGKYDIPFSMAINDNSDIFVAGNVNYGMNDGSGIFGAVSKFSSTGNPIWMVIEDSSKYPQSTTPLRSLAPTSDGGTYVAFNFYLKNGGGYLVKKNGNGSEAWRLDINDPLNGVSAITSYNDTLVALKTDFTNAKILFVTPDGKLVRTISTHIGVINTNSAIRIWKGNIFVFSKRLGGVVSNMTGYVAKFDLESGNLIWEKDIPDAFCTQGDVDPNGNIFVGLTLIDPTGTLPFSMRKMDKDGNVIWNRTWFTGDSTNNFDFINSIVFGGSNRIALVGTIQVDQDNHQVSNWYAYAMVRNATTGDSVWSILTSFQPITQNLDGNNMSGAAFSGNQLVMVGNSFPSSLTPTGRNVGYLLNYAVTTDGVEKTSNDIPEGFSLSQNYPNPFNPTTKIRFEVPKQGLVRLAVYDVLGREVKLLVQEIKTAGTYEVEFDASGLPSGTYFYRLTAGSPTGGFTQTRRMVLVK